MSLLRDPRAQTMARLLTSLDLGIFRKAGRGFLRLALGRARSCRQGFWLRYQRWRQGNVAAPLGMEVHLQGASPFDGTDPQTTAAACSGS